MTILTTTTHGLLVDVEPGVLGFIHNTEASLSRLTRPRGIDFHKGKMIKVQVLSLWSAKKRLDLSARALIQTPWAEALIRYPIGSVVDGIVYDTPGSILVELEPGVDAIIKQADRVDRIKVKAGSLVRAVVVGVDSAARQVALSQKLFHDRTWSRATAILGVGATFSGVVRTLVDYGAFVDVMPGFSGLLHIADLPRRFASDHRTHFHLGDSVDVVVLGADPSSRRLRLGLK